MSNRRMMERLTEIPVVKFITKEDEYGEPEYILYHSYTQGFINPNSAINTISIYGSYLLNNAVFYTQDSNFNPDKDEDGNNYYILTDYLYYDGAWWSPSQYVDFSKTTFGNYKQYQIIDDRTRVTPWEEYSDYYDNPPQYSEIIAFENAVGSLGTKLTFKIEPNINKLIEAL